MYSYIHVLPLHVRRLLHPVTHFAACTNLNVHADDMVPAITHVVQLPQLTTDMQSSGRFKCLSIENMEQVSR